MSYEVFPSTPIPRYTYVSDQIYRTIISEFESGKEQRRRAWRFPKLIFNLVYNAINISSEDRANLIQFFAKNSGAYQPFWFFDFVDRKWFDRYVGYGDGNTRTFDVPVKNTIESPKIYVDGEGVPAQELEFYNGTGEGGADQVYFKNSPPASGKLITADVIGKLRILGRFKDDKLSEELINKDLENIVFSIHEVFP